MQRKRPEEKPKAQLKLVETTKPVVDDADREKAREEFKKLFPNARKTVAPSSRRTDK